MSGQKLPAGDNEPNRFLHDDWRRGRRSDLGTRSRFSCWLPTAAVLVGVPARTNGSRKSPNAINSPAAIAPIEIIYGIVEPRPEQQGISQSVLVESREQVRSTRSGAPAVSIFSRDLASGYQRSLILSLAAQRSHSSPCRRTSAAPPHRLSSRELYRGLTSSNLSANSCKTPR